MRSSCVAQCVHALLEPGNETIVDTLLHKQARSGATDLALIEPDGIDHTFDGALDVRIIKDDEGRFAAEFQGQRLAAAGCIGANDAADIG